MKIKIWGARGSIPAPLTPEAVRDKIFQAIMGLGREIDPTDPQAVRAYIASLDPLLSGTAGGNTPCVEVQYDDNIIIIDAGSGIRELGQALMQGPCGRGQGKLHLFFSHAHWDHIHGFPFFRPAFVPGNRIFIYHAHAYDWEQDVLGEQQRPINFPIPLSYMQAAFEFVRLPADQTHRIGRLKINHQKMSHPGDAYAFRFETGHSTFVYASDAEYQDFDEVSLRPYLDFFKEADVLIFDAHLSTKETFNDKVDWGHSSALIGADLAQRAGVKKLVLFHHDPIATDADLRRVQAETVEYQAQDTRYRPCEVMIAYEGLTFELTPPRTITLNRLTEGDAAILTLSPVFDERSVEEVEQRLTDLTENGWPARLIIDFSQVESLAIVGLKPLVALRREHEEKLIALVGLSDRVRRVIKLAGFSDFFRIYGSVDEALATPKIHDIEGLLINERYLIAETIGKSWLGVVYKATDTQLNASIAVKILATSFSRQAITAFSDQARQIIQLDHPNIVNVLECKEDKTNGLTYITQDFMEGLTLYDILQERGNNPLPLDQAINIGLNIARALAYAHGRKVIHGDLRPRNIFLTKDISLTTPHNSLGTVKLTDFGLGRLREGKNLLEEILVLKTAAYLAPEQIVGEALDARTDLYGLGVILYELVTGRPPFKGSDEQVMQAHLQEAPPRLRQLNSKISPSLEHFILKLLAKNPDDRYATAHQTQRVLSNLGFHEKSSEGEEAGLSRQHQQPMIGRRDSLQTILAAWEQAQNGAGQLLLVTGETGLGKTRLAQEVAHLAEAGTLLVGQCQALEGSLAYQPFIEALRTYFATVPPSPGDDDIIAQLLANVVRWVPEIRGIMPNIPEAPPLEPKQEQLRLMNSLAQYIEHATRQHPWLLILDDLHWADQSSLQLLHYLGRHCASMSLLIIGAYADTDLENDHPLLEMLRGLQHTQSYQRIALDRLNQLEVGAMLANIWGQTVPEALVAQIYQVTEGNPFYVEEVAKGLVDDETVRWQDGAWQFSVEKGVRLPQSVRDAVLRRVSHLSHDTQGLLRQAAVLGRTFSFEDLQQVSNLSEWAVLEHLDVALERQLIEEAPGETMLRFRHAEIQHVLYQELSTLRRRLLHRQAGQALELRHLSDSGHLAEELAHHFDEAGEFEKALIYSIHAARHADSAYASQTALMWYERALKMLDQLDLKESTQVQRFELLLARVRLYSRQGMREEQAADLDAAQELAQHLNDPLKQGQVHNQQSYYYRLISNYPLAKHNAELALQAARQAGHAVLEGESLSNLAYVEEDRDQYHLALQHMEAAQVILRKTSDRRGEAIALKGLGTLQLRLNNYERAQAYYEGALAMNQTLGNRRGEAACINNLGELERERGNYSAARSYYEQTLSVGQAIGDRQGEAISLHNLSLVYLALGSYEKAKSYVAQAAPIFHSIDYEVGVAQTLIVQSAIHYALTDYESACSDARQALQIFQKLTQPADIAAAQLALGLALEALGELEAGEEAYQQALAQLINIGNEIDALEAKAGLARCFLIQNNLPEALIQIEESLGWLRDHSLTGLDHPFRFYLTAYEVLLNAEKPDRAKHLLAEAHDLLQSRAAKIDDEQLRHSFLENVPQNQAIMAAWAKVSVA